MPWLKLPWAKIVKETWPSSWKYHANASQYIWTDHVQNTVSLINLKLNIELSKSMHSTKKCTGPCWLAIFGFVVICINFLFNTYCRLQHLAPLHITSRGRYQGGSYWWSWLFRWDEDCCATHCNFQVSIVFHLYCTLKGKSAKELDSIWQMCIHTGIKTKTEAGKPKTM